MNKKYRELLVDLVVIAMLVSLASDLAIGAVEDAFGVCGFSDEICHQITIQAVYKAVFALIFSVAAVIVCFMVSKDFKEPEE